MILETREREKKRAGGLKIKRHSSRQLIDCKKGNFFHVDEDFAPFRWTLLNCLFIFADLRPPPVTSKDTEEFRRPRLLAHHTFFPNSILNKFCEKGWKMSPKLISLCYQRTIKCFHIDEQWEREKRWSLFKMQKCLWGRLSLAPVLRLEGHHDAAFHKCFVTVVWNEKHSRNSLEARRIIWFSWLCFAVLFVCSTTSLSATIMNQKYFRVL